jgi:hydrogenase-4 component B
MNTFFLALTLILAGGIAPLLLHRQFAAMKAAGTIAIATGSLLGAVFAGGALFSPQALSAAWPFLRRFSLLWYADGLSAFFLLVIFSVSLLAAVYSYHYLDRPERSLGIAAHYLFFSLLTVSMALVVVAGDMLSFMLAWEGMSISSFFLVMHHYGSEDNRKAGYLYFVYAHVGAMLILAAFGMLYAASGSLAFALPPGASPALKAVVFTLALIGFASKAGAFPLHAWLPHAHPAAPSHISALMSGVMIKTGIYGILRIYSLLQWHSPLCGQAVLGLGLLSGVLGVVYAIGQHDLKRLLAYHSVENIGIILIGMGIGMLGVSAGQPIMAVLGFAGALLHVLNHALFKSLLFLNAGMVLKSTGTRTLDRLGGLLKGNKITGVTFLVGSLAISGLPPFNGFVGEFLIYLGAFRGVGLGGWSFVSGLLAVIGLAVIGGLALACFTKVFGIVFQGEPRSRAAGEAAESGTSMLLPMVALAAACTAIGIFPNTFVAAAIRGASAVGMGYGRLPLEPFLQMTGQITRASALLLCLGMACFALRRLLYRGKTVAHGSTWGCGFTRPNARMQYTAASYAASILEFFRPVAPQHEDLHGVAGRFPPAARYHCQVQDPAEFLLQQTIVRWVLAFFDRLRWIQHGDIHLYIGYILLAIVVLLFFV